MEDSPSGLWRTLGKRVGVTASRVRISYPPLAGLSKKFESPFLFAENSFLSTIPNGLDCRNSFLVVSSEGVRPDDIGGTLRGASGRPNRCTTLCLKGATHDIR